MSALRELLEKGGPVMIAIGALSVVLYWHCFRLLGSLWCARRRLAQAAAPTPAELPRLRRMRDEIQQAFAGQRLAVGAMIAAAPLLGLLGTVTGMERTFKSLSARAGETSVEGLASGISEVLVATESGLAVALPALLLVYLAHREVHRHVQRMNDIEQRIRREGVAP